MYVTTVLEQRSGKSRESAMAILLGLLLCFCYDRRIGLGTDLEIQKFSNSMLLGVSYQKSFA